MKQKMKHAISFIALLAMLVSMFSVCVIPAAAADAYEMLLAEAYVVNPAWKNMAEGSPISFDFQGKKVEMSGHTTFNSAYHFADFDSAYAQAKADGVKVPVILLTAGTYDKTINIKGAVQLLGANAGIDPNVKSDNKNVAWTNKRSDLTKETVITANIDINVSVGANDLTFDGLTFANGGALVDNHRDKGASTLTVKNTVFNKAGNASTLYFALYLRSSNHDRTLKLQNLYITGQNTETAEGEPMASFICPTFVNLYADNIAYVENKVGFLASTWFTAGKSPVIEVTNSCFYNAKDSTPVGHIISMDNQATNYNKVVTKEVSQRPSATLKLIGNIFYNASATTSAKNANVQGGIIHFQFVNSGSVYNVQDNYFYGKDGTSFMDSEFLVNATLADMSSCMVVKNNWLIGAYKVPNLKGSFRETYIDMSLNYFARTTGEIMTSTLFMSKDDQRLIRTEFWVDMNKTKKNTEWDIVTSDWSLAWVDNNKYNVDIFAYTEGGKSGALPIKFNAKRSGLQIQLYKNAVLDVDGAPISVKDPISSIDSSMLNADPYVPTILYLQVTDPANPAFAPIYTLTISNCGDTDNMVDFSEAFPGHFMYHPTASKVSVGDKIPYKWSNQIYLLEVGKNLFASPSEAISYGYGAGYEIPTICIPAGTYIEELVLPGSCTILGEQHGINPNVKPYEYLTQEKLATSGWTLNPKRADFSRETVYNACIRVAEGADDYIITIDGITMGEGCSYVDDGARQSDNVTILKNIHAYNAGGGLDRNGTNNIYLFNFNKAFGPVTDRATLYFYDNRVDGTNGRHFFGPYYEKLVLDGSYFANATNKSYFFRSMQSRDIADPYYGITNSYIHNNDGEGQSQIYMFSTNDVNGNLAAKTNIIYNLDGNVMNYGFQGGYATMEVLFTGTNMTFYFTNNTFRNKYGGGFFANTSNSRYRGTCAQEDCSEILVFKGNRIIENNFASGTQGTGYGTMIDYSGNYWSANIDSPGQLPSEVRKLQPTETPPGTFTYEECTRYDLSYTYLDWDMTVRSDEVLNAKSYLNLSSGMNGTGTVTDEFINGKQMKIFRDKVSADVRSYSSPASAGEFDTIKYFSDSACTNEVFELTLDKSVNEFYGVVYPYGYSAENPAGEIPFKMVIDRAAGTEASLVSMQGALVDQVNKTVLYEMPNTQQILYLSDLAVEVSDGATYAIYSDAGCTTKADDGYFTAFGGPLPTFYVKVVNEDTKTVNIYKLTIKAIIPGTCGTAAVTNIIGMVNEGNDVYSAEVATIDGTYAFNPIPYVGSTIKAEYGKTLLSPQADGSYIIDMGTAKTANVKMTVTSQNGANTKVYTLKFTKVDSNSAELFGIENAVLMSTGYSMSLDMGVVVDKVNAEVAPGATYKLYSDYECTKPLADGPIVLDKESKVVYVKVTSANGALSTVTRLTIHTSALVKNAPGFAASVGEATYKALPINRTDFNVYLPAGINEAGLKASFEAVKDFAAQFFADPYRQIEIDPSKISLDQKITQIYYTIPDVSYTKEVPPTPDALPVEQTINLKGESGVINIISDRESVAYSDMDKVANWVKPYVNYLNDNHFGIFEGNKDKKINTANNITRNEIAAVATRVMGLDVTKFNDVKLDFADSVSNWAQPYVRAAVGAGMINGIYDATTGKTYFKGASNATREQVIKIFVCVCMAKDGIVEDGKTYYTAHKNNVDILYNTFTFEDETTVANWAKPYMHLAIGKYQIVNGSLKDGKLYLNPKKNITRAEVAKMMACYLGY